MNSRERVMAVFNKQIPDRVPMFNFWMDENVLKKIDANISWPDFCVREDLDIIVVDMDHDVEVLDENNGIFKNEWGVIRKRATEKITIPIDGPIKTTQDLKKYTPPDPTDINRLYSLREIVKNYKSKKIIAMHIHDAFNIPWYLRGGIDRLLIDYYDNPQLSRDLANISTDYYLEIVKQALHIGADIFIIGDDYAYKNGPLMSPKNFEDFILPGLARIVSEIKENCSYCIKHTDGDITPIIDMIISSGIDALHPIEPNVGMDIAEIKQKYSDKICVCGNVDVGYILSEATPDEVEFCVKDLINKVSKNGRHIISDSSSILSTVKPENYIRMIDSIKKFGRYPQFEQKN
jgi:uroporphyrinogen decarboxylase